MIVCMCCRLSDRQINQAIDRGASSVAQVFRAHDCRPNCGHCVCHIQSAIAAAQITSAAEPALVMT